MSNEVLQWLGCGSVVVVVTAIIDIIKYLIKRKEEKSGKKDSLSAAMRFCLLGEFERYCHTLEEEHDRPTAAEFHRVQEMYNLYKDLGGDGYADAIFNTVKVLYEKRSD